MEKKIRGDSALYREVNATELQQQPWISICAIDIKDLNGEGSRGTGWLVAGHTVITAAHVVWIKIENEELSVELTFPSLGRTIIAEDVKAHPSFSSNGTRAFDFFDIAALKLPSPHSPALSVAPFAARIPVEVAGFPSLDVSPRVLVTQRAEAELVSIPSQPQFLLHQADTLPGHSGAPLVQPSGVVGMHVYDEKALFLRDDLVSFIQKYVSDWS